MLGNAYYGYGSPMMDYGYGLGYGYEWVRIIFSIFWIVILIAIIVTAIRFLRGKSRWHMRGMHLGDSAMDILRERYAKGEISQAEFEEKKKHLSA